MNSVSNAAREVIQRNDDAVEFADGVGSFTKTQ